MEVLPVGEFKAKFSSLLKQVESGKSVGVSYGKKKEKTAVLIPYKQYQQPKRKLGIMEGKASFEFKDNFKMTDEEFLDS